MIEPLVETAARLGKALPSDVSCTTAAAERATWARNNQGNVPAATCYATHLARLIIILIRLIRDAMMRMMTEPEYSSISPRLITRARSSRQPNGHRFPQMELLVITRKWRTATKRRTITSFCRAAS